MTIVLTFVMMTTGLDAVTAFSAVRDIWIGVREGLDLDSMALSLPQVLALALVQWMNVVVLTADTTSHYFIIIFHTIFCLWGVFYKKKNIYLGLYAS